MGSSNGTVRLAGTLAPPPRGFHGKWKARVDDCYSMNTVTMAPGGPDTKALPAVAPQAAAATHPVPWYCFVVVFGAMSIAVGLIWDISWHRTIGRDTFWTPAHMAIYLGGVLGGATSGWLVFKTTFFGTAEERARSVKVWGMRGPLGAWVSIWGAIAMVTSAPFDDWWHNAYGVDVKILSPPHMVLAAGTGRWLFVFACGVLLTMAATVLIEGSFPNHQHTSYFYKVSCATYPIYLLGFARASGMRWSGTLIGLVYMGIVMALNWILPLFPAQPLLGPVYNKVDHMVPLPFPLLLVVPGFALDLLQLDRAGTRLGAGLVDGVRFSGCVHGGFRSDAVVFL